MTSDRVDVEQVLRSIRDDIRRRHPEPDLPSWSRPEAPALDGSAPTSQIELPPPPLVFSPHLKHLNESWQLHPHFPIESHRPVVGAIIVTGKRLVRKAVMGLFVPLFDQISAFFSNVTNLLNALARDLELVADRSTRNVERLSQRVSDVDERHGHAERELVARVERAEKLLVERMDLLYGRLDRDLIALERRFEELEAAGASGSSRGPRGESD